MTTHSKDKDPWQALRKQVLGLGEHSYRKNYYPQLQQQLDELSRFRTLLDASIDAIVLVELPQGIIVDFNRSLLRLLKVDKKQIDETPEIERWFGPQLLEHFRHDLMHEDPREESRTTIETEILAKDTHVDIQATVGLTQLENKAFAVVVLRDVTSQRMVERQLHVAQKLESVARLAGGIAHDFNNLLNAIIGYSELIHMRPDDPNKTREFAGEIIRAGNLASDLTRKILAFSKRQKLAVEPFSVNSLVEDMKKMLLRLLGEDVELLTNLDADPDIVEADIGQFEQVVMNLAVNARDAMPEGGTLIIDTRNTEILKVKQLDTGSIGPGFYLVLSVSDTGTGMDAATKAQIFEPFFTTKREKGTGLGLATIYGIVKQSEGGIDVQSAPGRGTKFEILLPSSSKSVLTEEGDTEQENLLSGSEVVLLVEDDSTVRNYVWRVLESYGYHVLVATNGVEALHLAERSRAHIDLLVTDIVMPLLDGTEVFKRLKQAHPALRVVYMTGYVEIRDSQMNELKLPKCGRLVTKPFRAATLLKAIRDVVECRE